MEKRPLKIGLSARLMHTPPKELGFRNKTLQYIEQSIAHWVMAHGALAFMVPTLETGGEVQRSSLSVKSVVHELDALLLQGGADVCPLSYGEEALRPEWSGDRIRDLYEIELFWEFVFQRKPVLGICRGAQLINVAMGGTLYQDILTQRPDAHPHVDADLYDKYFHGIDILPESRLAQLYPDHTTAHVNSIHHQAVKDLGNDLAIEAVSERDGIVEAIRWKGDGFVAGFQWHPEFHGSNRDLLDSAPALLDFLFAAEQQRDSR